MDPKTCPHCGYIWTPRKENPKKCPQCANPLWQSPRPKKKKPVDAVKHFEDGEAVFILPKGIRFPVEDVNQPLNDVLLPISDRESNLAAARAKAEALFSKLK